MIETRKVLLCARCLGHCPGGPFYPGNAAREIRAVAKSNGWVYLPGVGDVCPDCIEEARAALAKAEQSPTQHQLRDICPDMFEARP